MIDLWTEQARRWAKVGPPLRPCEADTRRILEVFRRDCRAGQELKGVLLGVTPEIASIEWDPPLHLTAVEASQSMIDWVWPGDTEQRRAVQGDWFSLPTNAFNFAVGDGCFSAIRYADYPKLAKSVFNALTPGGVFSIRLFKRPDTAEGLVRVWRDLRQRRIENFHIFKWRIAMSLQEGNVEEGVILDDIWDEIITHVRTLDNLSTISGWPLDTIETIRNYRGQGDRYTFPKVQEVVRAAVDAGLTFVEGWFGSYAFAERCPHLVFRKP